MMTMQSSVAHVAIAAGLLLAGCSKSTQLTAPGRSSEGAQDPSRAALSAEDARDRGHDQDGDGFVPRSNNPYFPLVPGTVFRYRSETADGVETEEFTVTRETKRIQGVTTIVVRDIVRLDGKVIERTLDYFASDEDGNVWYFGEDARSIDPETGEVSTEGSWRAGRDGAEAGIIMKAHPQVGDTYNEENAPGVAQDQARVLALDAHATVPGGDYPICLQTENSTPLDPQSHENKFYALGVGLVLEIDVTDNTRNELVSIKRGESRRDEDDDRALLDARD